MVVAPPANYMVVHQPPQSATHGMNGANAVNAMETTPPPSNHRVVLPQPAAVPMEMCPQPANLQNQVSPQPLSKGISLRTPETQRPPWLHKPSVDGKYDRQGNPSARRNAFRASKSEPNSPQDPNLRKIFRGQVPQSPEVVEFSSHFRKSSSIIVFCKSLEISIRLGGSMIVTPIPGKELAFIYLSLSSGASNVLTGYDDWNADGVVVKNYQGENLLFYFNQDNLFRLFKPVINKVFVIVRTLHANS